MPLQHFKFGGSTAKRTLNCPAWTHLAEKLPPGRVSAAAELGTALHSIIEDCLHDVDLDPRDFIGQKVEGVAITHDHVMTKIYPALDAFEDFIEEHDLEFILEETMEMSPTVGGSPDFIGWNQEKNVFACLDYKSGDGIMVDAEDNDQLLFYAMLAASHSTFKFDNKTRIILGIIQPTERRDYVSDIWETDFKTLSAWKDKMVTAVKAAEVTDPQPNAGDWCRFCPAEAVCPKKTGEAQQAMRLKTDSMELAALNEAMKIVKGVEEWAAAVRKLAHDQAEQGVKIEGWKLVNKRAVRVWNDPDAIAKKLKLMRKLKLEDYMEMKVMSAPKLEKVCKAMGVDFKQFQDYISSVSSGTTLAIESDKRTEIVPTAALKALADRL